MENENEEWGRIAPTFDSREINSESRGVENRLIAHPLALEWLKKYCKPASNNSRISVLDFGAGPGAFCKTLAEQGFQVTGMDFSKAMIAIAESSCPKEIRFIEGGISSLRQLDESFHAIAAMMVLQFIPDLHQAIGSFSAKLRPKGIFIFAVHNPEWAHALLEEHKKFSNPRQTPDGEMMDFELQPGDIVANHLRTESFYKTAFEKHSFAHLETAYPLYTKEFIEKNNPKGPAHVSKFLMMAFLKR